MRGGAFLGFLVLAAALLGWVDAAAADAPKSGAPGAVDLVHRHHAHAFVYVLQGSIVMGLRGGKEVTLTAGQTFYEGPDDVHTVGRNASKTEPARFVVFLLKDRGAPVLTPAK